MSDTGEMPRGDFVWRRALNRRQCGDRRRTPRPQPRRLSDVVALEERALLSAYPFAAGAADQAWMKQLETGTGDVVVPDAGVVIDRKVVVTKAHRIVGDGNAVRFVGEGQILIVMADPQAKFAVKDAVIDWYRDPKISPDFLNCFYALNGGFLFENNTVTSHLMPEEPADPVWYDDGTKNWFLRTGSSTTNVSSLSVVNNTFTNENQYSTGLMVMLGKSYVSGVRIEGNSISNYHGAIYVSNVLGASIDDNRLFRNSFGNIVVNNAKNSQISGNIVELPGNGTTGDGMTLANLDGNVIKNNTIVNGSCYGIWMIQSVARTTLYRNTIHGGITDAVNIIGSGVYTDIRLIENTFTANQGYAVNAARVNGLSLVGNVVGGNYTVPGGRQHRFNNVTGITAVGNLWASADVTASGDVGATLGTNLWQYSFGDLPVAKSSASTAVAGALPLRPALPTTTATANKAWVDKLESDVGSVALPNTGITIDRTVVIRNPRQIVGNGATLRFVGAGRIVVAMKDPKSEFSFSGTKVLWSRTKATDAQQIVFLQRGGLRASGNFIFADSAPLANDGPSMFNLAGLATAPSAIFFTSNTVMSRYWATVGLVRSTDPKGLASFTFTDNTVKNMHGGIRLAGATNVQILRNTFERTSLNNIDLTKIGGGQIVNNRLLFAGNGAPGVGIVVTGSQGLSIRRNVIFEPQRNGITLSNMTDTTVADNLIYRSHAGGLQVIGSTNLPAIGIVVEGNMFVKNVAYGFVAQAAPDIVVRNNLFQENGTVKGVEYLLVAATNLQIVSQNGTALKSPVVAGNLRDFAQSADDVKNPKSRGTNVLTYDL